MRALLLYNPNATTTNPAVRDVIAKALSAELKLEVAPTKRRDHASYLAAGAVHEGHEVVLALGGDGTVNEVLQGVAGTDVRLGIIPGGSTNVWARALGLPNDPVEATAALLRRLRQRQDRVVNLGTANGRYFGFTAGFGYDAEVVRAVERRYRLKRTVRQVSFLYCGLLTHLFGYDRRAADITVTTGDGQRLGGLRSVVCCNSTPYTFLGPYAALLCPDADLDLGLDLTALQRLSTIGLLRLTRTAFTSGNVDALPWVHTWHDQTRYELCNPAPLPLQLDGDFVGLTDRVRLDSVPRALTVVA